MYKESFPSKLKQAREEMGITQVEVAEALKTEQNTISKYENGKIEPKIEMIGKLCDLYHISADWLIGTRYQKG